MTEAEASAARDAAEAAAARDAAEAAAAEAQAAEEVAAVACGGTVGLMAVPRGLIAARWNHQLTMGGEGPVEIHWCGAGAVEVDEVVVSTAPGGHWIRKFEPGQQRLTRGRPVTVMVPGLPGAGRAPVTVVALDEAGHAYRTEATVVSIDDPARTAAIAACTACRGAWGSVGMAGTERCDCPTGDAGRRCTSDDDCESVCIATGWEAVPAGAPIAGSPASAPIAGSPAAPTVTTCDRGERLERLVGRCHHHQLAFGCRPRISDPAPRCQPIGFGRRLYSVCTD